MVQKDLMFDHKTTRVANVTKVMEYNQCEGDHFLQKLGPLFNARVKASQLGVETFMVRAQKKIEGSAISQEAYGDSVETFTV